MSAQIDVLRLKVERANKHFNDFKIAVHESLGSEPTLHSHSVQGQPDGTLKYSTDFPKPTAQAGLVFGDAIHQLRATLDHLVCALAMRQHDRTVCKDNRLQFPICKSAHDFQSFHQHQLMKGQAISLFEHIVGLDAFRLVKECQPYERDPGNPKEHPLFILSNLDNIQKHRIILVLDQRLNIKGRIVDGNGVVPFHRRDHPAVNGAQVVDVGRPLPQGSFHMEVDQAARSIVLQETDGICDGKRAMALFRDMRAAVTDVLTRFDKLF